MAESPGKRSGKPADASDDVGVGEAEAADTVDDTDGDDTISRTRLIAEARAFTGYDPHEVAGALSSQTKTQFTPAEATSLTAAWLAHPVQTEEEA